MKDIAEAFARLVADWSVDQGISSTAAVVALSGTKAWAEARQRHKAGATEQVVREWLSAALAAPQWRSDPARIGQEDRRAIYFSLPGIFPLLSPRGGIE